MKVALVHEFLNQYGGAERVLEAIHELYPYSTVYTALYDPTKLPLRMKNWEIRPFRLPRIPLMKAYTFFYPLLFEGLDLSDYDLVISSSASFAKGVLTKPKTLHLSYIHTPPRFLYKYPTETNRRQIWFLKPFLAPLDNYLRIWDYAAAQRPNFLLANSKETAKRINKFYRREATVIYPPVELPKSNRQIVQPSNRQPYLRSADVEVEKVLETKAKGSYFLVVSRLVAYKRIDLAIEAANKLKLPLKIVGTGKEEARLKRLAGPTVEFLGFLNDDRLSDAYHNCQAIIFPTDEDFGITSVEAMSFGKPVVALAKGGALETVLPGKTGEFFKEQSADSLVEVLRWFDPSKYDSAACRTQAKKFSKARFQKEFGSFVLSSLRSVALRSREGESKLHARTSRS